MFIKKDLRKVEQILVDRNDTRVELKLANRKTEFCGSLNILCQKSKLPYLSLLRVLNLYDNNISDITDIELLAETPIEEINLGMNSLSSIPLEFGTISTIKSLWLEDNNLEEFPICLCQLSNLTKLHISNNMIKSLPLAIASLENLEILSIENNELSEFPNGLLSLKKLKHLFLRQNEISLLPDNLDKLIQLETLSIGSNCLESLPNCLINIPNLSKIYANSNKIVTLPQDLPLHTNLKMINLANNLIVELPIEWISNWGDFDVNTGKLVSNIEDGEKAMVSIILLGNPFIKKSTTLNQLSSI